MHAEDFGAMRIPSIASVGMKRCMLADEASWQLFLKYLVKEVNEDEAK